MGRSAGRLMRHLLNRAVGDADAARDDVRAFVVEHLAESDAVLVVDETGDLEKGKATAGVQRQYTGTADRIENSQVAVYLAHATRSGHALREPASPPSRNWPRRWSPGLWMRGYPPAG